MSVTTDRTQTEGGETFESLAPATGEVVATLPVHGEAEVREAVQRARKAAQWWSTLPFDERGRRLRAFAGVLGGGFLADRLLDRGVLRARLYVTAAGFAGAGVFYVLAFSTTTLWQAAILLAVGSAMSQLPLGPQFALMMDVTPAPLRSQASAALNVLQASGALGPLCVGILSTAFGENLRLALLCMSPFYAIGALVVYAARHTLVEDVAMVVADARSRTAASES